MLLAAQHGTVVWHAGSSGAATMDRSSLRAEGLARSLSKAGGINFEVKEREGNPLTNGARAVAASRSRRPKVAGPMRLAARQCQAWLLLLPDHSTQPHFDRHSTKPPIAPAPPHIHLSTLHNGRVRPLCSCATRLSCQLTSGRRALPLPVIARTDSLQLGLPRKQGSALPAPLPAARWSEDLGEGAFDMRSGRGG